ncbi:biopolymer transporter ExbD [Xylella fastidiosa subsp. morus]|jgi:biopolymer transport protein ExbD|uniref:Biopolymer transport ExbD1 protein n=3 Tax=Xylella fastidiosa TaxID=2371 RepID=Q87FB6_XYLFT|nr:biopolymer transporter ExbD [Xylella fastidiosa]ADN63004.1 biopolymer transport ExbD1 protein [Xylella fastidiosa subsp. fastidiosa GB514]KAF0570969.1 biopolymer transporter ExbD [Xylella fastidiosa subsp. fastidiosa Mus-1]AAO27919.1 biopolymer transport ExbD1 protein [Xylella fastidiosa Temecula1]AIC09211.1 biopolymer transporter ExbD [Xylella fastidiosa subsp. sandyi Ann-1]AIC13349.1 biopolymer transporter ExbD [Xylella fastidiosa MUL0034]
MAFSNGNSNGPMADINVTPLVDVMLVLLIIFIITAPLMSHKVKVELPQANLVNKNNEEKRSNPITLAVKEDGSLYWNDIQISESELEQRFSLAAQQTPQPPLNLRGDRTTKMSKISKIIKVAQGQGIMDIGFIATKEKE